MKNLTMEQIRVEIQMNARDYAQLMLKNYIRRPFFLIFTIIGIIFLSFSAIMSLVYSMAFDLFFTIFWGCMVFLMPLFIYFFSIRSFKSNLRLQEKMVYTLNPEGMQIKGESFETRFSWDKVHKVTEVGQHFLIYENRMVAFLLPYSSFDEEKIVRFRVLLRSVPGLEGKLKKLKK
ncbi:MAG: YcxB family protein [Bacteroidia bacterium]|nr:YcxB family protein [Bacteroidia bacterium]